MKDKNSKAAKDMNDAKDEKNQKTKRLAKFGSKAADVAKKAAKKAAKDGVETIATKANESKDAIVETTANGIRVTKAGIDSLKENSPASRIKRARISGFRNGIKQGIHLAGEARHNFYYAYVATLCYFLRSDDEISEEEFDWLEELLDHLRLDGGVPERVKEKLTEIAYTPYSEFEEIVIYLDNVDIDRLESINIDIIRAVELDGTISPEEEEAQRAFEEYSLNRKVSDYADGSRRIDKAILESIREYENNIDQIEEEFRRRTKLNKQDAAFITGATLLQVLRAIVLNKLTEIEKAGSQNKKEKKLHDLQDNLFEKPLEKSKNSKTRPNEELYASMTHILSTRGVPYDATAGGAKTELFKGANHRFGTLGHDPVLGLIFGTANIMTNTITGLGTGIIQSHLPKTNIVRYNSLGMSPQIAKDVSTIQMLGAAVDRVKNEPEAAAASLLKQLIHIGTDLYTPLGIQLPMANIMFNRENAKKLTDYVSTGDVLKVGAQAGLAALINWLVAALHGSSLIFDDDGSEFSNELHQARTKKIILISNSLAELIVTSYAIVTKDLNRLDIGGAAVLVYQLFTSANFIAKLKEDYLNSSLDCIYDERIEDL